MASYVVVAVSVVEFSKLDCEDTVYAPGYALTLRVFVSSADETF